MDKEERSIATTESEVQALSIEGVGRNDLHLVSPWVQRELVRIAGHAANLVPSIK
jgi:hypothetical protein